MLRIATIVGLVTISACSSSGEYSKGNTTAPYLTIEDKNRMLATLLVRKKACVEDVNKKYGSVNDYYHHYISNSLGNGYFNKKYSDDFIALTDEEDKCYLDYASSIVGLTDYFYVDLIRIDYARQTQYHRELANGHLSFARYRSLLAASGEKTRSDYAAAKASQEAAARQQATAKAAEETQQAEADAEEQERTNAQTTAMMGAMMGLMNQPTYMAPGRGSNYVAPSVAGTSSRPASSSSSRNHCGGDIADLRTGRCEAGNP